MKSLLDMTKFQRRKKRQQFMEDAANDHQDRRHRNFKLADARMEWDRYLAELRRERLEKESTA